MQQTRAADKDAKAQHVLAQPKTNVSHRPADPVWIQVGTLTERSCSTVPSPPDRPWLALRFTAADALGAVRKGALQTGAERAPLALRHGHCQGTAAGYASGGRDASSRAPVCAGAGRRSAAGTHGE